MSVKLKTGSNPCPQCCCLYCFVVYGNTDWQSMHNAVSPTRSVSTRRSAVYHDFSFHTRRTCSSSARILWFSSWKKQSFVYCLSWLRSQLLLANCHLVHKLRQILDEKNVIRYYLFRQSVLVSSSWHVECYKAIVWAFSVLQGNCLWLSSLAGLCKLVTDMLSCRYVA